MNLCVRVLLSVADRVHVIVRCLSVTACVNKRE